MKYIFLFISIGLIISIGVLTVSAYFKTDVPESAKVISDLEFAIKKAEELGDYKCCIEPSCKMCYLGNWIFEQGKCDCDGLIAQGKLDQVCPECKKWIENGECQSQLESCPIEGS